MQSFPHDRLISNETRLFRRLNTPQKVQDFLLTIPFNFETAGDTCMSPRRVLAMRSAHCFEGALLAACALWFHGEPPMLLDLDVAKGDVNHTIALFRRHRCWGAISQTNHAVLRFREPVYRTVRELAMSYFHEYFLNDGRKTLRAYSRPFDLSRLNDPSWVTAADDVWHIHDALHETRYFPILTPAMVKTLRLADPVEIEAGKIVQWKTEQDMKP